MKLFLLSFWALTSWSAPLPTSKIVVAFGYKDTRPSRLVGDRYERMILVEKVLKLGFKRNPRDEEEFDLETKKKNFKLKIFNSAAGPDDQKNRVDPYQNYKSAMARVSFLSSLQDADLVIYNGHSRDGGGPDFSPPRLLANGHVNYPWYRKEHRSKNEFLEEWKKSPNRPNQLGLISCYSEQHFLKSLQTICPETKITTVKNLVYYSDALQMIYDQIIAKIRD